MTEMRVYKNNDLRSAGYILHPGALDACLRVIAYREVLQVWDTGFWFPKRIKRFIHYQETNSSSLFAYIRLNRWEPGSSFFSGIRETCSDILFLIAI
jgi:hypothetical protein